VREDPMITTSDIDYQSGQHVQWLAGGGLGTLLPVADGNERLHASVRDADAFSAIAQDAKIVRSAS
jgi:hypothetical protein